MFIVYTLTKDGKGMDDDDDDDDDDVDDDDDDDGDDDDHDYDNDIVAILTNCKREYKHSNQLSWVTLPVTKLNKLFRFIMLL